MSRTFSTTTVVLYMGQDFTAMLKWLCEALLQHVHNDNNNMFIRCNVYHGHQLSLPCYHANTR